MELSTICTNLRQCIECDTCGEPNPPHRCSRCNLVYYCSKECQRKDWSTEHKRKCKQIEVMRLEQESSRVEIPVVLEPVNTSCGICLGDSIHHPYILPKCRHAFCLACLMQWQGYRKYEAPEDRVKESFCPLCRVPMEGCVVDAIIETARDYFGIAESSSDDSVQSEFYERAIAEVDKILEAEPDDLMTLCAKGQILLHLDPTEAVHIFERVMKLDEFGDSIRTELSIQQNALEAAMSSGQLDEVRRLQGVVAALEKDRCHWKYYAGDGPSRLFPIRMHHAESLEASGQWEEAYLQYMDMENTGVVPREIGDMFRLCSGLSRCFYHMGDYDGAISFGEEATILGRQVPGAHKLLALPQRAMALENSAGTPDLQSAIRTMSRAVLYEAPWDDDNRRLNLAYLEELREEAAGTGAAKENQENVCL